MFHVAHMDVSRHAYECVMSKAMSKDVDVNAAITKVAVWCSVVQFVAVCRSVQMWM